MIGISLTSLRQGYMTRARPLLSGTCGIASGSIPTETMPSRAQTRPLRPPNVISGARVLLSGLYTMISRSKSTGSTPSQVQTQAPKPPNIISEARPLLFRPCGIGPRSTSTELIPSEHQAQAPRPPIVVRTPSQNSRTHEKSIFQGRLATIAKGLRTLQNRWTYERFPEALPWEDLVTRYTPSPVQELLASAHTPTIMSLSCLEQHNYAPNRSAAIFAWLLRPKGSKKFIDQHCCVYIDSRNLFYGRTRSSSSQSYRFQLRAPIRKRGFWLLKGTPVTLLDIPVGEDTHEEHLEHTALLAVAKAVFATWLGAIVKGLKPRAEGMGPWRGDDIRYQGLQAPDLLTTDSKDMERAAWGSGMIPKLGVIHVR